MNKTTAQRFRDHLVLAIAIYSSVSQFVYNIAHKAT